jgi:hypothetical protein
MSRGNYVGASRIVPSSRITSPFSISLPTIACTSLAQSAGVPSWLGKGTPAAVHPDLLGHAEQHRCAEEARSDGHAADAVAGQVAGDRRCWRRRHHLQIASAARRITLKLPIRLMLRIFGWCASVKSDGVPAARHAAADHP